jgi:hypothetical protein
LDDYKEPDHYRPVYHGHIKIVSDGSNQGLTGYQSAPYLCDPVNNTRYSIFHKQAFLPIQFRQAIIL